MIFDYIIYEWRKEDGWCEKSRGQVYLMPFPTKEDDVVNIDGELYEVWTIKSSDRPDAIPVIELTPMLCVPE